MWMKQQLRVTICVNCISIVVLATRYYCQQLITIGQYQKPSHIRLTLRYSHLDILNLQFLLPLGMSRRIQLNHDDTSID